MPVPLAVALAPAAIQAGGAIINGMSKNASNREVRRQNRYTRRLSDKENFINELEYNQDRPLDYQSKQIDADMKRMKYLDFLRQRGLI